MWQALSAGEAVSLANTKEREQAVICQGLTKHYGAKVAVDGVDWVVPRGSVVGLVGPNGAGKSTTLKMLIGLVHPTGGRAEVLLRCDQGRLGHSSAHRLHGRRRRPLSLDDRRRRLRLFAVAVPDME